jgi:hypothetical protein
MKKVILIILLLVLSLSQLLYADGKKKNDVRHGKGWAYSTETEYQAFPEYCKARFYPDNSSIYKKWRKKIGSDFIHFHHY